MVLVKLASYLVKLFIFKLNSNFLTKMEKYPTVQAPLILKKGARKSSQ